MHDSLLAAALWLRHGHAAGATEPAWTQSDAEGAPTAAAATGGHWTMSPTAEHNTVSGRSLCVLRAFRASGGSRDTQARAQLRGGALRLSVWLLQGHN